ncbi:SMC family ATPase [Trebonia kvetii]|uniref:Nuclease SbcCD subunit C n=1 Tax=Trebonia kvetii TaxID=2480626 RepID=A0A6P2BQ58_9ACTN|nr:SMC family ATPase [Trebonia kvetii]TVZ01134.1 SMC family ATPase [Trebonia kvetii]
MRPHRLRVTAFGAFAAAEQVVFDDLDGLFLLHGETGAGKTTLLDAIAFALYGRVPGERGSARRLRSDHAAAGVATEVELEATIGGRRLRITRRPEQDRPRRSGGGTTKDQASIRLAEQDRDGGWTVTSSRLGEADREIADLMGMSAEQFFQVVLLPQGQFAQFLHARAQEKEALLQKLFGTDRFSQVEDWLADRRRATDKEVSTAEDSVALLVAQLAQAADVEVPESASALPHEAVGLHDTLTPDSGDVSRTPSGWQGIWASGLSRAAVAEQEAAAALVAARKADLETALAAMAHAERLADRQRRRQGALLRQRDLQDATPELQRLPGDQASLRAAGQAQQAQVGRLEALRAVARQADVEDESATTARARAAGIEDDLEDLTADVQRLRGARPEAEQARDEAARAAGALPAVRARADSARLVASDAAALVAEHGRRGELREAHLTAREEAVAAQAEALRIRAARIDGMRAELAAQMTDESPCPVCGSLDHPDPVDAESFPPVSRSEEDTAVAHADEAARAADQAGQRVAAVDAVIADLTRRLTAARFFESHPTIAETPPADEPSTHPADEPSTHRRNAAAAKARAPRAAGTDDAPVLRAEALAGAVRAAEAGADLLEAEASLLSASAATLSARQGELDDLDRSIAAGQARLAELTEQRLAAIAEAEAAESRAARNRAELAARLGDAGDLADAIAHATRLADVLIEAAAVAGQLADPELDVALDPPAPVAEAAAAAGTAHQAHDEANTALGTARHRARQLAELRPRLDQALRALGPLRERAGQIRQLADLAEGRGANQYKMTLSSFVLAARLEEVAAAASERLRTMTAGRYSLVHSDARKGNAKAGLSLLACDAWTGIDRDTATLSGGETFLASLSLALGLADVVTAESAGTPMEALFVDEGFGTLDEETLDEVMNVLDGLRAGGRIVGIVSHVAELRQRIPARIHVRKTRSGSHVEVNSG